MTRRTVFDMLPEDAICETMEEKLERWKRRLDAREAEKHG